MNFSGLLSRLLSEDGYVIDEYAGKWRLRHIRGGEIISSRTYDSRAEAEASAPGQVVFR